MSSRQSSQTAISGETSVTSSETLSLFLISKDLKFKTSTFSILIVEIDDASGANSSRVSINNLRF